MEIVLINNELDQLQCHNKSQDRPGNRDDDGLRKVTHPKKGYADSQKAQWSAHAILRILQDETYTGVLLQGKQSTHNHKIKDIIEKPAEEWIRTENARAPIIRKHDFELVQKIMGLDTRTAPDGDAVYLFSGILICRSCGGRMTRKTNTVKGKKYIYYHCPTGKKHGCEHPTMLREDELTACVLESLQVHIRNVVSLDKLLDRALRRYRPKAGFRWIRILRS